MARWRKRGTNSYQLIYELGYDAEGKRFKPITKTIKCAGSKDADSELSKFVNEIETGIHLKPEKMHFSSFVELWEKDYLILEKRPTTVENYKIQLKNHILPVLEHKKMDQIITMELQKLMNNLERKDGKTGELSPSSRIYVYHVLASIFDIATKWKIIKTNPLDGVTKPKLVEKKEEFHEIEELQTFLDALQGAPKHYQLMIELALYLGLRRGEILGLEWDCIDFEKGSLEVRQSWFRKRIGPPKSEHGYRLLDMPGSLLADLKEYHEEWKQFKIVVGHSGDFVFCNEHGEPLLERSVNRWLERFVNRHGLRKITMHDFRRMYTVVMISHGATVKEVQEQLGHGDVRTTLKHYDRVLKSKKKETANKMDVFRQTMNGVGPN